MLDFCLHWLIRKSECFAKFTKYRRQSTRVVKILHQKFSGWERTGYSAAQESARLRKLRRIKQRKEPDFPAIILFRYSDAEPKAEDENEAEDDWLGKARSQT